MRNDFSSNYLMHHGILGQKWGKKNGPPYPLDAKDHSSSEKKAGWRDSLKAKKEAKKKAKQQKVALEKARKAKVEKAKQAKLQKEYEENKQKVLTSGKASEVYKYQGAMSNKELGDAVQRIRWETELRDMASREQKSDFEKLDAVMKKAKTVTDWARTGKEAYNLIAEYHNAFRAKEDKDRWPKIGSEEKKDKKKKEQ